MDDEVVSEFLTDADERMAKSVEATRSEFATVRTLEKLVRVDSTDLCIRSRASWR